MQEFTISYQMTRADYSEANALLWPRAQRGVRWEMWSLWGAAVLLLVLPLTYRTTGEEWNYPALVVPFAGALLYIGMLYASPRFNAWCSYRLIDLANESFAATFSPESVTIKGKHNVSRHDWQAFKLVLDSPRLFLFHDGTIMFIFAKRHFAPEQIESLQQLIKDCWRPGASVLA